MYNLDRRIVAKSIYSCLHSLRKTAVLLKVSHSTVSRWLHNPEKKPYKKRTEFKSQHIIEIIKTSILIDPFISICTLRKNILSTLNVSVSRELIRTCISKLGHTRKKARFFGCPKNLEEKTNLFLGERSKHINEGKIWFSQDETSFGRNGKQMMGYSPRGKQLRIQKSQARMTTVSSLECKAQT